MRATLTESSARGRKVAAQQVRILPDPFLSDTVNAGTLQLGVTAGETADGSVAQRQS